MALKLTLPAFGAAAFVAILFGLHIGQSAIDQINPLFFQGAPVHPRDRGAEVSQTSLAPPAPRFAEYYGWEEGQAARAADCRDCDALAARDAYQGAVEYAVLEPGWRTAIEPVVYEARKAPEAEPEIAAEPSEVERFASYPIEEKPVETEPVERVEPVALQE
jgi:hypothetical protein